MSTAAERRYERIQGRLNKAEALLRDTQEALVALASAERSRNHYRTHIKNHAELAPGHLITEVVRNHQIRKIDDFLRSK